MTKIEALALLPESKGVAVILSGGMDSSIALRLCVEKYGKHNVRALTFDYGQRQRREIAMATRVCKRLGVRQDIVRLTYLKKFCEGYSANVDRKVKMPTIKEVLGDPSPKTEVPFRNMMLLTIAASFSQVTNLEHIICGLQVHDAYGYWDTTEDFITKMNAVLDLNRKDKIKVIAPFSSLSKYEEINILNELDGDLTLLENTLTCYDPDSKGKSCGKCPSCAERIMNFAKTGFTDPVPYQISIPWGKLIRENYIECAPSVEASTQTS